MQQPMAQTAMNQFQSQPANTSASSNKNKILSTFMSQFISQDFMELIVNVSMYQVELNSANRSSKTTDTMDIIRTFIIDTYKDIDKMKLLNLGYPITVIKSSLQFAKRVIELRNDIGSRLITYDNLEDHFKNSDIHIQKMIQNIKQKQIRNIDEFKQQFDIVVQTVQLGNEIRQMRGIIDNWDQFIETAESGNVPLINLATEYKNLLVDAYNGLSSLKTVNKVSDFSDYLLFSDEQSIKVIANDLTSYLSSGYTFYKSGFRLIDETLHGIEAATLHLICGPTNNAKSLFMINLSWQMIMNNINTFQPEDLFVFYTLEDDIRKLLRRFMCVYGNVESEAVTSLFIKASALLQGQKKTDINGNGPLYQKVQSILEELLQQAILHNTGKKVQIVLKHHRDAATPSDFTKFIDYQRCEGRRVKGLFIDYLDMIAPSSSRYTKYDDYNSHGIITQELRNIAGEYCIPVITITQGTRESESVSSMTTGNIGNSYKKAQYSDYIYMVRLRYDLNLLSDCVKEHILPLDSSETLTLTDITSQSNKNLRPFEIKISKAKDGDKNVLRYHLFNGSNLRIYEQLPVFYSDLPMMQMRTKNLRNQIDLLNVSSMQLPGNDMQLIL